MDITPRDDDVLTLRQGMAAHRASLGEAYIALDDPDAAELFHAHDAIHVLFGCDTSLRGESLADLWTLAASDITVAQYLTYLNHPDVQAAFKGHSAWDWLRTFLKLIPDLFRVLVRARRMPRRWPAASWRSKLDIPVKTLREAWHIQPIGR